MIRFKVSYEDNIQNDHSFVNFIILLRPMDNLDKVTKNTVEEFIPI